MLRIGRFLPGGHKMTIKIELKYLSRIRISHQSDVVPDVFLKIAAGTEKVRWSQRTHGQRAPVVREVNPMRVAIQWRRWIAANDNQRFFCVGVMDQLEPRHGREITHRSAA